ncbi:MAG: uracil phosphoribosyltransferase [Bacteroidia bacterium]|nr:uracil phosphoribosyltransferase [Bacteroidia bacterium]
MDTRVTVVGNRPSYLNQIIFEMRDRKVQQDRMRFRRNLSRTGQILAYEISKELEYESRTVTTPLGELDMHLPEAQPVIVSILRAGLPFHQGFLELFDEADNGFIAAYRHITKGNEFEIRIEYQAMPEITNRTMILVDPMIATGKSLVMCHRQLLERGRPERIFVAGVVASEEGLEYVLRNIPNARIFVGSVDRELTAKSYIVPGLGDAGDLAFGPK